MDPKGKLGKQSTGRGGGAASIHCKPAPAAKHRDTAARRILLHTARFLNDATIKRSISTIFKFIATEAILE